MFPTWSEMLRAYGRIGLLSFGGPAAQISVMHEELVEKRKWLAEKDFLGALSFCMLLPGPEAMQLATYTGWKQRGTAGGLLAGLLFTLPGAFVIGCLAFAYAAWGDLPGVQPAFLGIKALVVVIVLQALRKIAKKALVGPGAWIVAGLAFVALFALGLPFPLIVLAAGLWGFVTTQGKRDAGPPAPQATVTLRTAALWLVLWALPLAPLYLLDQQFLIAIALFFAKLAIVTFGGAYAVLAYMAQEVVQTHGWLTPDQMIDALGLAETTPGPLILVTQFTAHLAGIGQGGVALGIWAGLITLWMTFVPCFLWIFALAPHVDRLLANPRLKGALQAITAAVVGVILNLTLWFTLHVVFVRIDETGTMPVPELASFDPRAAGLIAFAAGLMFLTRTGIFTALGIMAALGASVAYFT